MAVEAKQRERAAETDMGVARLLSKQRAMRVDRIAFEEHKRRSRAEQYYHFCDSSTDLI